MFEAIFVTRWPWYVGGAAIGAFVILLAVAGKQRLGVSTGFGDACAAFVDDRARKSWRLPFLGGIVLGGLVATLLAGGAPTTAMGMFDTLFAAPLAVRAGLFAAGGVLIGFGTRLAGGCTSGHGIVGMAQLAPASLIATGTFMAAGFGVTHALWAVLGGQP